MLGRARIERLASDDSQANIYSLPQPLGKHEKETSRCVFVLKYMAVFP